MYFPNSCVLYLCYSVLFYRSVTSAKFSRGTCARTLAEDINSIFIHSFIPRTNAECEDSLPFSWASSVPLCYIPFLSFFSTNYSSILPHFFLSSISWSTAWSVWFQIHIQYFLVILFSSILCTCPEQRNMCNLIASVVVGGFLFSKWLKLLSVPLDHSKLQWSD
jgi:hypothetical protein